jgi:5-formyltetrahydrofolate cyclo-ligase
MTKKDLRKHYISKRLSMTDSQRSRLDDLILIRFQQWLIPDQVESVLSFWPLMEKGEPNTFLITDFMAFRNPGLTLAYPVSNFEQLSIDAGMVDDDTDYKMNQYGIAEPVNNRLIEPQSLDMVIVPLLAFDQQGYRLGYGKGFYDRFLSKCRPDLIKLGLSYFGPEAVIPGIDQFDVPLNLCITPDQIYEF